MPKNMRTAGTGRHGDLWHGTTVEKWVITDTPYRTEDRQQLRVDNKEDALEIGRILQRSRSSGIFITHVTEVQYHMLDEVSKAQHPERLNG
jgi:hypothetical protein